MADRVYEGGYHTYGAPLGIMMLDTEFPRPPGDVGNHRTFDYPVDYEIVEGASPVRVVREQDPALVEPFVDAARRLEDRGAVAITTSCGFLLPFQDDIAGEVGIPVFTSSLLQVPLVAAMIPPDRAVGVVSADEGALDRIDHPVLSEYDDRLVVEGIADNEHFQTVITEESGEALDLDAVETDVVAAARRTADAGAGAVVFECTNLRPYVGAVQDETGLPVFDFLTLSDMAYRAARRTRY